MSRTYRVLAVLVMVMSLVADPALVAWGNPPAGRWEKVSALKPGEWMRVYTQDALQNNYRFVSVNNEFLTCTDTFNEEIQIEISSIRKIVLEDSGSLKKQGALVGGLGGAVGGLALMGIGSSYGTGSVLFFTGITAALGASAGYLIGSAASGSGETIYISKKTALAEVK